MSRENVEFVRRANEAFNRGDYADYLGDVAPDFEYVASGVIPGGGGVYRGREEYGRFMRESSASSTTSVPRSTSSLRREIRCCFL